MWNDRRLCDLFGIEHPILQAPMAGSSTPAMAAAVSNAGGLGAVACAEAPPVAVRASVEEVRGLTNRPVNVNFFAHSAADEDPGATQRARGHSDRFARSLGVTLPTTLGPAKAGFDAARLELVLDIRPPIVSFHFGLPDADAVAAIRAAGIRIVSTATTVSEARALEKAGVDAVIAQGYEAGGHRGSHRPTLAGEGVGTMALVPQVVDAVDVPVIAAGGIGDARGIAAALALGASGVQMGSAFLRCPESAIPERRRQLIARSDGGDTMVTAGVSGRAARARRSDYALHMAALDGHLPPFPTLYGFSGRLLDAAGEDRDDEVGFHLYGQAAGLARALPAGDLVAALARETRALIDGLCAKRA